ncbi:hypothetical protein T492DRAFT_840184 [Pavlovales sp. CCMP2436]|nr:hypothetical protein T492DRAFT_840184 [Pavlovales sp. CCMP2436]
MTARSEWRTASVVAPGLLPVLLIALAATAAATAAALPRVATTLLPLLGAFAGAQLIAFTLSRRGSALRVRAPAHLPSELSAALLGEGRRDDEPPDDARAADAAAVRSQPPPRAARWLPLGCALALAIAVARPTATSLPLLLLALAALRTWAREPPSAHAPRSAPWRAAASRDWRALAWLAGAAALSWALQFAGHIFALWFAPSAAAPSLWFRLALAIPEPPPALAASSIGAAVLAGFGALGGGIAGCAVQARAAATSPAAAGEDAGGGMPAIHDAGLPDGGVPRGPPGDVFLYCLPPLGGEGGYIGSFDLRGYAMLASVRRWISVLARNPESRILLAQATAAWLLLSAALPPLGGRADALHAPLLLSAICVGVCPGARRGVLGVADE